MEYVHTEAGLDALAHAIAGAPLLALDTEAAGYHRYLDRICLMQLSTRTHTFLVDALAITDLAPLKPILASAETEIVLHDADYDLRLLRRDHGIGINVLFDTKVAAQFLGEPAIGLASLAEKHLGVRLDKRHQRADWAHRPLAPELLEYAAEDTRHLPRLRDIVRDALQAAGRLHWAEEEFARIVATQADATVGDTEPFLRLKNTRDLRPRQLAALRELHAWREDVARERDLAPFRVISNETIITIARRMPEHARELSDIPGFSPALMQRRGADVIAALRRARDLPDDQLPVRPRPPRRPPVDPELEALIDRLKAARDAVADRLTLDRGFLMPRQQLEEIARLRPKNEHALLSVGDMRRWQVEAAGSELLAVVGS
jgi:ribonuclease D